MIQLQLQLTTTHRPPTSYPSMGIWMGKAGNENEDELATNGSTTPFAGQEPCISVSPSPLKQLTLKWKSFFKLLVIAQYC